jgi:hypothetical protein
MARHPAARGFAVCLIELLRPLLRHVFLAFRVRDPHQRLRGFAVLQQKCAYKLFAPFVTIRHDTNPRGSSGIDILNKQILCKIKLA